MKERPIIFSGKMVKSILAGRKTQTRQVIRPQPILSGPDIIGPEEWLMRLPGSLFGEPNPMLADLGPLCPYGTPGDNLWVRETWRIGAWNEDIGEVCVDYRADNHARQEWLKVEDEEQFDRLWIQSTDDALTSGLEAGEDGTYHWEPGKGPTRWRPSIHMPRWASRITLEMVSRWAERVHDISEQDTIAEGVHQVEDRVRGHSWEIEFGLGWFDTPTLAFRALWDSLNAKRGVGWETNPWVWVLEFRQVGGGDFRGMEADDD